MSQFHDAEIPNSTTARGAAPPPAPPAEKAAIRPAPPKPSPHRKVLQSIKQSAPAPAPPTAKTHGPPVIALQQQGVYLPIKDVNAKVEDMVTAHQMVFGNKPPASLIYDLLRADNNIQKTKVSYHDLFSMPPKDTMEATVRQVAKENPPSKIVTEITPENVDRLIMGMKGHANSGVLQSFLDSHHDMVMQAMDNPETRDKMNAAILDANAMDEFENMKSHESAWSVAKAVTSFGPKVAYAAAKDTGILLKGVHEDLAAADPTNLRHVGHSTIGTEHTRASAGFDNLFQIAPAVAQVVQSLVYSPVGLVILANQVNKDLDAVISIDSRGVHGGDFSFKHTRGAVEDMGKAVWEDITHPGDNAGFLFLDGLAVFSGGAGFVTRLGRAGTIAREGGTVGESLNAFRAPHDLRTYTLTNDGFSEQIRLAQNPIIRKAQEWWYERLQTKHDSEDGFSNLAGDPIIPFEGSLTRRVLDWSDNKNPLGLERTMGRAYNIRTAAEYKGLTAAASFLADSYGSSVRKWKIGKIIPDAIFKGLTAPEMKALEAMSYDFKAGKSPAQIMTEMEQYAIDNHFGKPKEHKRNLVLIRKAGEVLDNLDAHPRLQEAIKAVQMVDEQQLKLKLAMRDSEGKPLITQQEAENRVILAGYMVEHFPEVAGKIIANKRAVEEVAAINKSIQRLGPLKEKNAKAHMTLRTKMEQALETVEAHKYPFKIINEPKLKDGSANPDHGKLALLTTEPTPYLSTPGPHLVEPPRHEVIVPLERQSDDSWYFAYSLKHHPQGKIGGRSTRVGQTGLLPAGVPPELRHEMTGESLIHGGYRIDIQNLAGEQLVRVARSFQQWTEWKSLWAGALKSDVQPEGYIPIRDTRDLPDGLRRTFNSFADEAIDSKAADGLPADMIQWLYPKDLTKLTAEERANVRWIDPRQIGNATKPYEVSGPAKAFSRVNDALRPLIFYMWPKYALNGVSNAAMMALDQGFIRGYTNLIQAMQLEHHLDELDVAKIKAEVGSGRAESYLGPVGTGHGAIHHVNETMAHFWGKMTDEKFREAAWIHYAKIKGYKEPEDWKRLLHDESPEGKAALNDVSRRANESLVAFDRMAPWERAWVRNFIFVYPWQRGAFMWSFRTVFEHPAKSALLAMLGNDAYEDDEWLKTATTWIKRTGFIGFGDVVGGKRHVYNPTSMSTFATWNDVLQTTKAAVTGDRYASIGDMLGPPGQIVTHAIMGTDEQGTPYEGSQIMGAIKGALTTIPAIAVFEAYMREKKNKGFKPTPIDIRNRRALIRRQNSYLKKIVQTPGSFGGIVRLIYGPDVWLDDNAMAARYWRDAPAQQKFDHETKLIKQLVRMQGEYLGRPVPANVMKAVNDERVFMKYMDKWHEGHPHAKKPTMKQILISRISMYRDLGRIEPEKAQNLLQTARGKDGPDVREMNAKMKMAYGFGADFAEWNSAVSRTYQVTHNFDYRMARLRGYNLGGATLAKAKRLQYAHGYNAYLAGLHKLQDAKSDGKATIDDIRAYKDSHDRPVVIDGKNLPSYARFEFTEHTTSQMHHHLARLVSNSWGKMTLAEKAAMGRPVEPIVQEAWHLYDATIKKIQDKFGSASRADKEWAAQQVAKKVPSFADDYTWSRKPRAERIAATPLYKELPPEAQQIFDNAIKIAKLIKADVEAGNGNSKRIRDKWNDYVQEQVRPYVNANPALRESLKPYGKKFLETMINSG